MPGKIAKAGISLRSIIEGRMVHPFPTSVVGGRSGLFPAQESPNYLNFLHYGEITVGPKILVLTASLLASQVAEGQVVSQQVVSHQSSSSGSCNCGTSSGSLMSRTVRTYDDSSSRPGLWSRFQGRFGGFFGRSGSEPTYIQESPRNVGVPVSEPAPEILQRMPNKVSFAEPPLETSPAVAPTTPAAVVANPPAPEMNIPAPGSEGHVAQVNFRPAQANQPSVIQAKFANKVGHEEDFSWITGQLGQANGRWVIHYATPETVDRFNGSLVLAGSADMGSFQVGDLVSIQGGVITLNNGRGSAYLIQAINLIEQK
jgi:hypothetical protein